MPMCALVVEQAFLGLHEGLGLADRRHVEVGEDVAQVLLRHGGADGADRDADHAGRLAGPGALAVGTRGVVDRVLQHAGNRAVVFGRHEQHALAARISRLQALDRRGLVAVVVLVVERQVVDAQVLEGEVRRRERPARVAPACG